MAKSHKKCRKGSRLIKARYSNGKYKKSHCSKRKSSKRKSPKRKSPKRKSPKRKSPKRRSASGRSSVGGGVGGCKAIKTESACGADPRCSYVNGACRAGYGSLQGVQYEGPMGPPSARLRSRR
jgi:hypothetical protein